MKKKDSQATEQNEQTTASEQVTASKPSKNGVFMMRGKGQSFDEYKKACIASLISAGLIKTKPNTQPENIPAGEQQPDKFELQASNLYEKELQEALDKKDQH